MKRFRGFTLTLALVVFGATQAFGQTIYNSIPSPLPGNLPSIAYSASQAEEFGDRVQFAGTSRTLTSVVQGMSSWGCESGFWYDGNTCTTTPGTTFSHPITLNIYNVGVGNQVGTLIASVTQTFAIPYRPSADPTNCTGGRWFESSTGSCFNGYANLITFNLTGMGIVVPNQAIYSIEFNTTHYGNPAIGESAACYTESGGCGYDSLNVLVDGDAPTVGVNPAPTDAYFSSLTGAQYCDGGVGGTGTFRLDVGCWLGFKPTVQFNAANPLPNKNACKNGGWQTFTRPDGSTFKNQGDCVSYASTGK
ncbi:MAG TPA: hypothetical protein VNO50_18355 [Pyrinomonadaceae bacterium]|nr:hypothetical protein [Pyrinomonadaceae bacterium]